MGRLSFLFSKKRQSLNKYLNKKMNIDWTEVLKFTLSIIAILISVISVTIALKNTQKQIRVNKLEEIVTILYNLHRMYKKMFWLLVDLQKELNSENEEFFGYDWNIEAETFLDSTKKLFT